MQAITDFLLIDHAPMQIALYSIPGVNLVARFIQSNSFLDEFFKNNDFSQANIDKLEIKKANFRKHLTTAIQIQTAVAIISFAIGLLFPSSLVVCSHVFTTFLALSFTNFVYDKILTLMGPTLISTSAGVRIVGY